MTGRIFPARWLVVSIPVENQTDQFWRGGAGEISQPAWMCQCCQNISFGLSWHQEWIMRHYPVTREQYFDKTRPNKDTGYRITNVTSQAVPWAPDRRYVIFPRETGELWWMCLWTWCEVKSVGVMWYCATTVSSGDTSSHWPLGEHIPWMPPTSLLWAT